MPLFEFKTKVIGYNYYEIEAKDEQAAIALYERVIPEAVALETVDEELISVTSVFGTDDPDDYDYDYPDEDLL